MSSRTGVLKNKNSGWYVYSQRDYGSSSLCYVSEIHEATTVKFQSKDLKLVTKYGYHSLSHMMISRIAGPSPACDEFVKSEMGDLIFVEVELTEIGVPI
jgi:hypothetical protein